MMNQSELIKKFESFINTKANSRYNYVQYDSPKDYFNKPLQCGICQRGNDWLFVYQEKPTEGDRPHNWFNIVYYTSLDKLIKTETSLIKRELNIA